MWQVVIREDGAETAVDYPSYFAAYAVYEKAAKRINATDKDGKYLNPESRICIRKV